MHLDLYTDDQAGEVERLTSAPDKGDGGVEPLPA
jgi:hypothetical protein